MNEVYFWLGLVVANLTLLMLWLITGYIGRRLWVRITRVYHLTVIGYWLNRLETEGTHVFEKARKEAAK